LRAFIKLLGLGKNICWPLLPLIKELYKASIRTCKTLLVNLATSRIITSNIFSFRWPFQYSFKSYLLLMILFLGRKRKKKKEKNILANILGGMYWYTSSPELQYSAVMAVGVSYFSTHQCFINFFTLHGIHHTVGSWHEYLLTPLAFD
jgi:hypothetical protein